MLCFFTNPPAPLQIIQPELARVYDILWGLGETDGAFLRDLVHDLLDRPTDISRAAAALLVAAATRDSVPDSVVQFAAAVQIVHAASFAHQFASWAGASHTPTLDDRLTVLAGDYLYARAAVLTAGLANLPVLASLAECIKTICRVELAQERRQFLRAHVPPIVSLPASQSQGLFRLSLWGTAELLNLDPTLQITLADLGQTLDDRSAAGYDPAATTYATRQTLYDPTAWTGMRNGPYLTVLLDMAARVATPATQGLA